MDTSRLPQLAAAPLVLVAALALGACSSGGESDTVDAGAAAEKPRAVAPGRALGEAFSQDTVEQSADVATREDAPSEGEVGERAIISKGVVALVDEDVAQARFDVQKIVDAHDGEVAEEKTETDDDGAVSRSRLVLRVPVGDFDATMEALEEVAELESSSRNSEDVTTTVIDNEVRIRAQTESLKRIEALLARAQTIRDIVSIESQLTRRQADLDSLKSQQAYLADQTSMSTITVFLERKPEPAAKTGKQEEATGFVAGLGRGWDALAAFATGAATVAGALLPFAGLFLLLGLPAWLLLRNLGRRRPTVAVPAGPE